MLINSLIIGSFELLQIFGNAGSFQLAGLNAKLIATRAHQSSDLRLETDATSAKHVLNCALWSALFTHYASVVIRVWTLCIIRSVPEQRQTILLISISSMRPRAQRSASTSMSWQVTSSKTPGFFQSHLRAQDLESKQLMAQSSLLRTHGSCSLPDVALNSGTDSAPAQRFHAAGSSEIRQKSGCCPPPRDGWSHLTQ